MEKPSVKIDDWAVVTNPNSGSHRELSLGNLLVGRVFGHPRIKEGMFIFSSPVVRIDLDNRVVETKNTAYLLGKMSLEYQAWSREHAGAVA
jgi:hypothetical protein